jgi:hypothetical protein
MTARKVEVRPGMCIRTVDETACQSYKVNFRNELMNPNSIVNILELEFPEVFVNQKVNLSSTIISQSKFFRV